jgi:hypothetical protein
MTAPRPPAEPYGQQHGGQYGAPYPGQYPPPGQHYPPLPYQRSPQEAYAADAAARLELAARHRSSRRRRWIIASIAALVLLIVIGSVAGRKPSAPAPNALINPPVSAAPQAAAPAVQSAPAAPAPAPAVPPQKFTGKGNDVVDLPTPLDAGVVQFDCAKCSRNVIVKTEGDLLVNTIGKYTGTRWITQQTSRFEIQATGSWTLTVGGFDLATTAGDKAPVSGHGDQVLLFPSSPDKAHLTHKGDRNFIVQVIGADSSYPDLLVNDIGSWDGTVAMPDAGSLALVQVTADGNWTLTPS